MTSTKHAPLVSIAIVTRNRKDDLVRALASCFAQAYQPLEILVFDDASTDGTPGAVRERFPDTQLHESSHPRGYIHHRNTAMATAKGTLLVSLDDDAYFTDANTVADIVDSFSTDEKIAALALPFMEPGSPPVPQPAAGADVRSYRGCAHALRRDVAHQLGGYREFFVHQGEERDLCIRILAQGHRVIYGASKPVVHAVSPVRDQGRMDFYGVRNTLLFDILNLPMPAVVLKLSSDAFRLWCHKLSWRNALLRAGYVVGGLLSCAKVAPQRNAVPADTYRRFRSLPGHGPMNHPGPIPAALSPKTQADA